MKTGQIIGNTYTAENRIAKSGMSEVFLVTTKEGDTYAAKVIDKNSKGYNASVSPDGTLTEVEIIRKLNHKSIPKVIAVLNTREEIIIVMEYIEGETVHRLLEKGTVIPIDTAVNWFMDLAELFIYLHGREKPIIYRDLKPANLILDKEGKIRLIDFGIAIELDRDTVSNTMALGTSGYCSPEHRKGTVDERADIYTLGMTMYSILSGSIASDRIEEDDTGKRTLVTYKAKRFSEIGKAVPKELEDIVFKAIEKDPDDRYMNASEILTDLIKYKEGKTPKKKKKDIKKILLVIAAVIVIIAAFLVVTLGSTSDIAMLSV